MNIKESEPVSDEVWRQIMQEILPKRAKLRAMNLLKSRDYTEKQLADKLRAGFYPEEIIEDAINYIKQYHYVDDYRYAEDYIRYHSASRSIGKISQDLQNKGISREIISEVLSEVESELPDEKQLILDTVKKKKWDLEAMDYAQKQKICAYLCRKGFSFDTIRAVIH